MKKTMIAILIVLMTVCMVACNGNVNAKLFEVASKENPKEETSYICFTAVKGGALVGMKRHDVGGIGEAPIQYSTDLKTWKTVTLSSDKISALTGISLANDGDKVYFRAKDGGNENLNNDAYYYFAIEKMDGATASPEVAVSGNIMALLDPTGKRTDVPESAFENLFKSCTYLTDAKDLILPATTLSKKCYDGMFSSCVALKTAPALPATTLAEKCYDNMFYLCSSLETAPELPATTLARYCYSSMFKNCSSLKKAPALPATTLANDCYNEMFYQCTSLTELTATGDVVLPATELALSCYYNMFFDCPNLDVRKDATANGGKIFTGFSTTNGCYAMFRLTKSDTDPYGGTPEANTAYYWYKQN